VIPLLVLAAGLAALAAGWLLVRRLGARARIGRILASTRAVPVDEAVRLAGGPPRYVAVEGRLDSEQEFPDEHGRPLVYRRSRLELLRGSRWEAVEDHRETVPFGLADGLATIALDAGALGDGLVVVVRESEGLASEIPDRVPEGTPGGTRARLRVEQVSSVEHGLALGVPVTGDDGATVLRPGLRRPLILTTLPRDDALRILAADHRTSTRLGALLMAGGLGVAAVGLVWAVVAALA